MPPLVRNDCAKTLAAVEGLNRFGRPRNTLELVGDEVIDHDFSREALFAELRNIITSFPATESSSFPLSSNDKVERPSLDLVT